MEYLRWLIETGVLEIDSRRRIGGLKSQFPLEGKVPSSLHSLVQARLSSMGNAARDLLKLAAVLGRTFDLRLLCTAAACEEIDAIDVIEPLVASGLILEAQQGAYQFSHEKLRQALYEGISGSRSRALHLRVAEALEEHDGDPAQLAHHYTRAQAWEQALENLVQTARRAQKSWAWENALKSYARALEVVEKLPNPDERRFELLEAQESLLERVDRRVERAIAVQRMFELANRLGDQARIAGVHIGRIGVLAGLADMEGAAEAYQMAVKIFRGLGDKAGEARAHREMGYVRWVQLDYAGSVEALFQAFRMHQEIGDRIGEAGDVSNIVETYIDSGDYERALKWAERAVEDYNDLEGYEGVIGEAVRLDTLVAFHRERGDLEAALSASLDILQMWTERGDKTWVATDSNNCAMLYLALGDCEEALKYFRAAAKISREMGHARDEGHSLLGIGISLEQAGDSSGAAEAYRRSVELLETAHELSGMPEELPAKAEALTLLATILHRSLGKSEEALDSYEAAAGIYRELHDTRHLRKVLLGIAGLRYRVGNLEDSAHDYEKVLESAQDDTIHRAAALASLSVVHRDLGHPKESLRSGREALRLLQELDDPQAEAYILTSVAESHSRLGQHSRARSCLQNSLKMRRKIGDEEGEVRALRDVAKIYIDLGDISRASVSLEEAGRKNEALQARAVSTAVRTRPAFTHSPPKKRDVSDRKVEVASARLAKADDRASSIRWLHAYISDERGRKFHFRYEAPSMETMLEDSRRAGLKIAPDAVAQFLEPGMFH